MEPRVGVVIPTFNSAHHLPQCLPPLLNSSLKPQILIIDSSSQDNTVLYARSLGITVTVIPKQEFNHGLTREKARKMLDVDIVVCMTPDAYAQETTLEKLIEPIVQKKAAIAYAKQIPHASHSFFASFPRQFNYPEQSHVRSEADRDKYGAYLYFNSDSCAAYCMQALDSIGGFQEVALGEDTLAAAQLLKKGHKIAYVAEAVVSHSHEYTLKQEFWRYFDTGIARARYRQMIGSAQEDTNRGKELAFSMLKALLKEKPYMIPYAILHLGAKWLGFKLGHVSAKC